MDFSSKLRLKLFGRGLGGDVQEDEPADISGINDNFRSIDEFIGMAYICTSTTRPSSPFPSLGIFETDTLRGYIYTGVSYQLVFDANFATGLRGTTAQRDTYWGAPTTGTTTAEIQARVALASQGPRWFNTEKGYEEQYFAKKDDTGLVAGLGAMTPGWYPSGSGVVPHARVRQKVGTACAYGSGTTVITTNSAFLEADGAEVGSLTYGKLDATGSGMRFTAPLEGKYRVKAHLWSNNALTLLIKRNSVSPDSNGVCASASPGSSSVAGFAQIAVDEIVSLSAGDFLILAWAATASGTLKIDQIYTNAMSLEWFGVREV